MNEVIKLYMKKYNEKKKHLDINYKISANKYLLYNSWCLINSFNPRIINLFDKINSPKTDFESYKLILIVLKLHEYFFHIKLLGLNENHSYTNQVKK